MNEARQTLAIIPARGGSKAIPRKNLVDLAGKPLLAYTIEAALQSQRLDRIILSTDDEEIAAFGRQYGVEIPFLRPAEYATDSATVESVILHALNWLEENENHLPHAFAILHPTTPLRTSVHIDESIAVFESSGADAVVSISVPMQHPCDMVYFQGSGMHWILPGKGYIAGLQRQGYPECYFINGAVYVTKTESFCRTGTRFGETTVPYFMDGLDSIDIDTQVDLIIAELLLRRRETMGLKHCKPKSD